MGLLLVATIEAKHYMSLFTSVGQLQMKLGKTDLCVHVVEKAPERPPCGPAAAVNIPQVSLPLPSDLPVSTNWGSECQKETIPLSQHK